jgi:signal transduction histidine kinase/CheY-like chemotaxis protein
MSITFSPIKDAAGRIVGASKVARDISERRSLEEQRALLLVREREARHQAEVLNTAKDELLATVSHELRTPLNSIFGWARMIQSGNLDEAAHARAISTILRSASAQARLVEDLIDLSRITTGRMRLDFERMNLNATIETALDAVGPAVRAKGITLVAALDESLGEIEGAPDRLQQVIWNLVMNSVKFTPSGGRVEVSSRRGTDSDSVAIVVKDSGRGIPAHVLPHVFEPFRQEDSSSTRAYGGLGLGLTLVRRLVELHGGQVVADSSGKDQGATFTVTLPLQTPGLKVAPPHAEGPSPADGSRLTLEGVRVLVVDDDPDFLQLSAMILRRAGAHVRAVSSAAGAHELVNTWLPNVLLTDLAMPDEDGFMLATTMRTVFTQRNTEVSIIAVTAYETPESRARAVLAGFDLYLTKPVEPVEFARVVAGAIRRES